MKVLFVTRTWPPAVGGMQTYCKELCHELEKISELEVEALPGKINGHSPSPQALVWFLIRNFFTLGFKKTYDVYHFGDLVIWPLAWVTMLFKPKSKIVITVHGLDLIYGNRPGLAPTIYRIYAKLAVALLGKRAVIVANSRGTAKLCETAGFKKIATTPLATTLQAKELDAVKTEPFVLFVGRLVKRKGPDWFAANVLPLLPKHITMKVAGPAWDKSIAEALNANPRVEYLGLVSNEELTSLRQRAIAVLMPNIIIGNHDFEGFGLTAPEAAAEGGILIASAIEGIPDAVIDGKTGFLVPENTPEAWVTKISELDKWSQKDRLKFIKQAQELVATHYSWKRVAKQTLESYNL
ncbi:MAG: glycosyltransferase family 4 protein [Micrococcales bacterium]